MIPSIFGSFSGFNSGGGQPPSFQGIVWNSGQLDILQLTPIGSPVLSTTQKKFGTSSVYFNYGDYLQVMSDPAFNFGTGDFTIAAWVYPTSNPTNNCFFITSGTDTGNSSYFGLNNYMGLTIGSGGSENLFNRSGASCPFNAWSHVAVSRQSSNLKLFINGEIVAIDTNSTTLYNFNINNFCLGYFNFSFGNGVNGQFVGYVEELAIWGSAFYTSNFTPPTAPYNISDDLLALFHFDR